MQNNLNTPISRQSDPQIQMDINESSAIDPLNPANLPKIETILRRYYSLAALRADAAQNIVNEKRLSDSTAIRFYIFKNSQVDFVPPPIMRLCEEWYFNYITNERRGRQGQKWDLSWKNAEAQREIQRLQAELDSALAADCSD